jgi:hypothetical protein
MTSEQPLRPYVLAAGVALGAYILVNIAIIWFLARPAGAPVAAADTAVAPAAAAPAATPDLASADTKAADTAAAAAVRAQGAQGGEAGAFELLPGAGDWVRDGGAIVQRSGQLADLFAGSSLLGSQYTASVDVLWPAQGGEQIGGGLIFHMGSPGELAGAQMVRFHRNGQELLWGHFDEQGVFQGEGGAGLALEAGKPHTLSIVVAETSFDVLVDGNVAAAKLPLQRQTGGIGLIAYGGPVTFTNLVMNSNGVVAPSN